MGGVGGKDPGPATPRDGNAVMASASLTIPFHTGPQQHARLMFESRCSVKNKVSQTTMYNDGSGFWGRVSCRGGHRSLMHRDYLLHSNRHQMAQHSGYSALALMI